MINCEPSTSTAHSAQASSTVSMATVPSGPSTLINRIARRPPPITVISLPPYIVQIIALLLLLPYAVKADSAARCYFFGPGMTINGADYRRDYGMSQRECGVVCKSDACCMAFEYVDGQCTLKSRSLNGTIVPKTDAFLGLCLDFENDERDRFWDHELGGTVAAEKPNMERDSCSEYCSSVENAVIYSWRTSNERDMDALTGHCKCISVLHNIKLSFGSFSGFLI